MPDASSPSADQLVELIRDNPLLSSIEDSHLQGLGENLEWIELDEGVELFHEGELVDAFYFLVSGTLEVSTVEKNGDKLVLAEVQSGATIGEMQILTGGRRSATVGGKSACQLVRFSKEAFDRFLASDPEVVKQLTKTIMPRLYRDQMVDVLPLMFGDLDEDLLHDLEEKMTWTHLPRGEVLFIQGEESKSFYIIISGRLRVLIQDGSSGMRQIGEMSQGESVGEMGVFADQPRSATVIASRDTELLEFSKEEFEELNSKYPQLLRHMTRLLISRLQRASRQSQTSTLSSNLVLASASDDAPLSDFAVRLCDALSKNDTCMLLTSDAVDRLLETQGIAQAEDGEPDDLRLRSWLNEQEKKYRLIVYQADATVTGWTRRCVRQADAIWLVANHSASGSLTDVEQELAKQTGTTQHRSLVLLHPDGSKPPSNTARWLDERSLDRHLHVRLDREDDVERVARFAAGRAIGLVLSGGGARGFAHVGIIQGMQESGIPIDMIAGVSMGALISAGYAYSDDFQGMVKRIRGQLKGAMNDYTVPLVSIARGSRFDRALKTIFPNLAINIEDLWTPFFCVSSNLTRGRIQTHHRGPLWRAVRASGSLPGIVTPVVQDGDLLYDGCLLNNLPMDVMRQQVGEGPVIAIDVVPPEDLAVDVSNIDSPSGWQILWSKLNPFVKTINFPNIVAILQRAGELGSVQGRQKLIEAGIADLYLRPPVEEFEILDFSTVDKIAEIGHDFGHERLASWWKRHKRQGNGAARSTDAA